MSSRGDNTEESVETTTTNKPTITVLYFAAALTATGLGSEHITLPSSSFKLSELSSLLVSRYPHSNLKHVLQTSRWAVPRPTTCAERYPRI